MMSKRRRNFTVAEKVSILRESLLDKVAVSDLCEKHGLQPTRFYQWQKRLFENADAAFARKSPNNGRKEAKRLALLEAKLRKKDEVLAELLEERVALKKTLGEI